jgi:uncharacterized protein DUF11
VALRRTKTILIKALAMLALVALLAGCSIPKTASPDPVTVGGQLTFNIEFNFDPGAPFTEIRDNLPNSVRFVSATADTGECSQEGGTVSCFVENPDPQSGGTATVTIIVTPTECGTFTNTASAVAPDFGPVLTREGLTEEQLATIEELTGQQLTAEQLSLEQLDLEQLTAEQLSTIQGLGLPTIEDSDSFTVDGCEEEQPQQ